MEKSKKIVISVVVIASVVSLVGIVIGINYDTDQKSSIPDYIGTIDTIQSKSVIQQYVWTVNEEPFSTSYETIIYEFYLDTELDRLPIRYVLVAEIEEIPNSLFLVNDSLKVSSGLNISVFGYWDNGIFIIENLIKN